MDGDTNRDMLDHARPSPQRCPWWHKRTEQHGKHNPRPDEKLQEHQRIAIFSVGPASPCVKKIGT